MEDYFIYVSGFSEPLQLDSQTNADQLRQTITGTASKPLQFVNVPRKRGNLMIPIGAIVGFESRLREA